MYQRVVSFSVEESVDSDHLPLTITIRQKKDSGVEEKERQRIGQQGRKKYIGWDPEEVMRYRENTDTEE